MKSTSIFIFKVNRRLSGFTLVELVTIIVILGILAVAAAPQPNLRGS